MEQRIVEQISRIEGGREDRAIKKFQQSADRHKAMLAKQQEFEEYRAEYERQIKDMGRAGIDSGVLANYHEFKNSLDAAIDQHGGLVSNAQNDVDSSRLDWSASHQRQQALRQLIDGQDKENRIVEEKRDQKLIDDICSMSRAH